MVTHAASDRQRAGDRGQLILIAAVIVATAVLGGVVLLNTIHASPDVSAQTDSQSVTNADQMSQQVQGDLHDIFMAAGEAETGIRVPGANGSELDILIEEYSERTTRILSTNRSALISVSLEESESKDGSVAYWNESTDEFVDDGQEWIIREADALPRFSISIEEMDSNDELSVKINDSSPDTDVEFTINEDGVEDENGDDFELETDADNDTIEIILHDGAGEIRTEDDYKTVALPDLDAYNVWFGTDDDIEGTYAVSGVDADECASPCRADVIVNPAFELSYQDPNVQYRSTIFLYGGADS